MALFLSMSWKHFRLGKLIDWFIRILLYYVWLSGDSKWYEYSCTFQSVPGSEL